MCPFPPGKCNVKTVCAVTKAQSEIMKQFSGPWEGSRAVFPSSHLERREKKTTQKPFTPDVPTKQSHSRKLSLSR